VPLVVVIVAVPAKLGEDIVPLPENVAEFVVIVYVPADSAWPLRVRPSVVSVIEELPVTVAAKLLQSLLTPRNDSAGP
jgi:hypothetical protein